MDRETRIQLEQTGFLKETDYRDELKKDIFEKVRMLINASCEGSTINRYEFLRRRHTKDDIQILTDIIRLFVKGGYIKRKGTYGQYIKTDKQFPPYDKWEDENQYTQKDLLKEIKSNNLNNK